MGSTVLVKLFAPSLRWHEGTYVLPLLGCIELQGGRIRLLQRFLFKIVLFLLSTEWEKVKTHTLESGDMGGTGFYFHVKIFNG